MYYAKWKEDSEYFIGMDKPYSWGCLKKAKGFGSKTEIEKHFKDGGAGYWLQKVDIIFFHPLNFEERIKSDR